MPGWITDINRSSNGSKDHIHMFYSKGCINVSWTPPLFSVAGIISIGIMDSIVIAGGPVEARVWIYHGDCFQDVSVTSKYFRREHL